MSRHEIHLASGEVERVDRLLARSLAGLSRRMVQRLLDEGRITIDGRSAKKGEVIRGERVLDVEVLGGGAAEILGEAEPALPILFEDEHCVAIDKPAGRPGHALRSEESGTVANFLAARFPECVAAGGTPLEAGLVHRLDTETSGVLLAARSPAAWQNLREQFRRRGVGKLYLAVVHGSLADGGEIRRAIRPDPRSRRKVRVLATEEPLHDARPALTRYRPRSGSAAFTLLEVEIPTGVMHQIRAHLAAIGHPVVGDTLYGGETTRAGRHLLHAARLAFDHPASGRRVTVESPLPADFAAAIHELALRA